MAVFTLSEQNRISTFILYQDFIHSQPMKHTLRLAIIFSLVLHLLLLWGMLSVRHTRPLQNQPAQTQITYVPAKPSPKTPAITQTEVKPQPLLPPPPEHNWDDPATANRVNQKAREGQNRQAAKQGNQRSPQLAETPQPLPLVNKAEEKTSSAPLLSATGEIKRDDAQAQQAARLKAIFGEDVVLAKLSDMPDKKGDNLQDQQLDDAVVHSPYTEDEERIARWYDEVYLRLGQQVKAVWQQPKSAKRFKGEIRLDLSVQGYLVDAWIHLPSGDRNLDASALQAIRSVPRYDLPHLAELARYYQHLRFTYQGED
ncbi:MAG: hypothetical protein H7A09_09845 [Oceanospirillaceae bacterium]|nr:hypothetical protein [Oceanospirillaceae bacterium]MCP5335158.1 hypothetical protein [Oceanospirillaceae bacterium]MCP5351494.1 hypothetical protein [Oceanospirillaceae bacterium]